MTDDKPLTGAEIAEALFRCEDFTYTGAQWEAHGGELVELVVAPPPGGDPSYAEYGHIADFGILEKEAEFCALARSLLPRALRDLQRCREALRSLYTFPGVRNLLAPRDSLGSIVAQVEEVLGEEP